MLSIVLVAIIASSLPHAAFPRENILKNLSGGGGGGGGGGSDGNTGLSAYSDTTYSDTS